MNDLDRRPVKISVRGALLDAVDALGINVSDLVERSLAAEVAEADAKAWQLRNEAGFAAWNAHVEHHGIPLAQFRKF